MKPWKLLGLAGLAGVAAGGVIVARSERSRRSLGPEDVRARLQERYREAAAAGDAAPASSPEAADAPGCLKAAWGRMRHPRRGR